MSDATTWRALRLLVAWAALAVGLGLYGWGALTSPVLDEARFRERALARQYVKENAPDPDLERALAEAYWRRYPNVYNDPYFGPQGMGVAGARAHFERHGKYAGYRWGLD